MMTIKDIYGNILYEINANSLDGADFSHAYLRNADFKHLMIKNANFASADCSGADFSYCSIYNSNFIGTSFSEAKLTNANYFNSDFLYAFITCSNATSCNFVDCNFDKTNMTLSNLSGTIFTRCKISFVKLTGSNLARVIFKQCDLNNIIYDETTAFFALQCPEEGSFIAYKKVNFFIIKLEIPADAKRSSSTTRKCRCSKAKVLGIYTRNKELTDMQCILNTSYCKTLYKVGKMVYPDSWDDNRWNECSHGIHFFMTFEEAVNY